MSQTTKSKRNVMEIMKLLSSVETRQRYVPIETGNINLNNRPLVFNSDGSISTVRSITIEQDGKHFIIPTLSPSGTQLSEEQAVQMFRQTGQHLGAFSSQKAADSAARDISYNQGLLFR